MREESAPHGTPRLKDMGFLQPQQFWYPPNKSLRNYSTLCQAEAFANAYRGMGKTSRAIGRTSNTGQGAWSRTKRATCPTDFGPRGGPALWAERGQMTTRSAAHSVAVLTISRSGRPSLRISSASGK